MNSRDKGKRGELAVRHMLEDRDYEVDNTRCGMETDDMIATKDGTSWSVEVKRCKLIDVTRFLSQARTQAKARRLPYMLVCHIASTSYHLVLRQGERPVVWYEKMPPTK